LKKGDGNNNNMKRIILVLSLFVISFLSYSQKDTKLIREGNKLYNDGKYKDAELNYRKALEFDKESVKGKFNLGDAVYKEKNFSESSKIFEDLSAKQLDKYAKAKVLHNLGNSLIEEKKYDQSISAYKNSLLNDPSDKDTKYNLEYAKMMLKNQQQQQKQNQDKKDQDKKDQDKKQEQNKEQNKSQDKKQAQDQPKKISKEDAERMLEALKNDEKKTMAKVKKEKAKVQQVTIEKDW
jgi:Ca-activated chloride channel homolog